MLVASIKPAVLKCIVSRAHGTIDKIKGVNHFHHYSWCLRNIKQRGQDLFIEKYVDFESRSEEYKKHQSTEAFRSISVLLGISEDERLEVEDRRAYDSNTLAIIDKEDTRFEDGFKLEIRKEEPKEKGKSMRVDRMIKKQIKVVKEAEKKTRGTEKRPIDQDKLVNTLFASKAREVIQSTSSGMFSTGDATKQMMASNLQRDLVKAGLAQDTQTESRPSRKAEARDDKSNLIVRHRTKR